ncbi:hypothetical protein JXL21_07325 [Candidatus Bathyarchaeota archaeon]|nr:hypothetical protein [Candidatus Bathyarchaeota archaeon]
MDELFDGPLKPMNSGNARLVYKLFYDARDQGLTTIDIQHLLEDYDRKYSKKDLHNWLNDLMASNLITKESQRGKPTIVPYNGRYTYDIWRLTPHGYQIGRKIEGFIGKYPNLIEEKIIEKTRLPTLHELKSSDLDTIQALYMNSAILTTIHESGGSTDLKSLSEKTMVKPEPLGRFLQTQQKNGSPPLYHLSEKPMGIAERILQTLGLSSFKNLVVSLSSEGKKIVEGLLSA